MYILKIVKCTYLLASKMALIAVFVCTFQMETNLTFISFLTEDARHISMRKEEVIKVMWRGKKEEKRKQFRGCN